jgi:hypothetical protein
VYRGSRKHILDWTEEPSFVPELLELADAATARVSPRSQWMPRSYREPDEARLETFGPKWMSEIGVWEQLRKWRLKHERGANTPNWAKDSLSSKGAFILRKLLKHDGAKFVEVMADLYRAAAPDPQDITKFEWGDDTALHGSQLGGDRRRAAADGAGVAVN